MKAAQAPGVGGGLPLGSGPNAGSHSPQHQQMHSGMYLFTGEKHTLPCCSLTIIYLCILRTCEIAINHRHLARAHSHSLRNGN